MANLPPTDVELLQQAIANLESELKAVVERTDEQDKILSSLWQRSHKNRKSIDRTISSLTIYAGVIVLFSLALFGVEIDQPGFKFALSGTTAVSMVAALAAALGPLVPTLAAGFEKLLKQYFRDSDSNQE